MKGNKKNVKLLYGVCLKRTYFSIPQMSFLINCRQENSTIVRDDFFLFDHMSEMINPSHYSAIDSIDRSIVRKTINFEILS